MLKVTKSRRQNNEKNYKDFFFGFIFGGVALGLPALILLVYFWSLL